MGGNCAWGQELLQLVARTLENRVPEGEGAKVSRADRTQGSVAA